MLAPLRWAAPHSASFCQAPSWLPAAASHGLLLCGAVAADTCLTQCLCRLPGLSSAGGQLVLMPHNLNLCQQGTLGALANHTFTAVSSSQLNLTSLPACAPGFQGLGPKPLNRPCALACALSGARRPTRLQEGRFASLHSAG